MVCTRILDKVVEYSVYPICADGILSVTTHQSKENKNGVKQVSRLQDRMFPNNERFERKKGKSTKSLIK